MGSVKIAVCGLGESIHGFDPTCFDITIGVNDIWRIIPTNYVVCLDHRDRFTADRLAVMDACEPVKFYSQLDEWSYRPDFHKITLQHDYPNFICQLDITPLPKSLCSPFVAAAIAQKYHGASEIHLFGVDMTNHPLLHDTSVDRIKRHFANLHYALRCKQIPLIVHGDGVLKELNKMVQ